jgi:cytochrome c556
LQKDCLDFIISAGTVKGHFVMKKISIFALILSITATVWAGSASAQFAKPEDAVKYRKSAFQLIRSHFGRMQAVMKGQSPYDKAEIQANVAVLSTLAALPWQAFPAGTESKDALADIWSDPAGFKAAQDKFKAAVGKLSAAADAGDLEKLRSAYADVGASCKACHDVYHEKK